MATNKTDKVLNVPTLRFPSFTEEWQKHSLDKLGTTIIGLTYSPSDVVKENGTIVFRSSNIQNGEIDYSDIVRVGKEIKPVLRTKESDILICARNGSSRLIGKNAILKKSDEGQTFGAFMMIYRSKYNKFIRQLLNTKRYSMQVAQNIGARINQITTSDLNNFIFNFPTNPHEQKKIADFLSLLDERIALQSKLIEDLKKLKSAIRANIFQRLKNAPTHTKSGAELLLYEQPTKYIVEDYEYSSDKTQTPVLTANKSLILGYTSENFGVYDKGNCIILDDFTLDMKFITFPFKVKSSAIKILTAKCGVNLRFIFEQLQWMGLTPLGHNRHYISMVEPMQFYCPSIEVQRNIAQLLDKADDKLRNELQLLELLIKQKSFLLSAMFI